jgi:hypothetical protein
MRSLTQRLKIFIASTKYFLAYGMGCLGRCGPKERKLDWGMIGLVEPGVDGFGF